VHARTRNASHHRGENDRTNGPKCVRFPPQGRKRPHDGSKCVRFPPQGRKQAPVRRPDGLRLQEQLRPAVLEVQAEMALVHVPSPTRNQKPISDCPDSDGPFSQTKQPNGGYRAFDELGDRRIKLMCPHRRAQIIRTVQWRRMFAARSIFDIAQDQLAFTTLVSEWTTRARLGSARIKASISEK
jgi:hypothetical protein